MFTESLAGTGIQYRRMQARQWNDGRLHFQVVGNEVNRSYGASFTVDASANIILAVQAATDKTLSLTGSGKVYGVVQAKQISENEIHVQVRGSTGNRGYGASFEVLVPLNINSLF